MASSACELIFVFPSSVVFFFSSFSLTFFPRKEKKPYLLSLSPLLAWQHRHTLLSYRQPRNLPSRHRLHHRPSPSHRHLHQQHPSPLNHLPMPPPLRPSMSPSCRAPRPRHSHRAARSSM